MLIGPTGYFASATFTRLPPLACLAAIFAAGLAGVLVATLVAARSADLAAVLAAGLESLAATLICLPPFSGAMILILPLPMMATVFDDVDASACALGIFSPVALAAATFGVSLAAAILVACPPLPLWCLATFTGAA